MNTTPLPRIVVGTDGSDNSLGALRWALKEGALRKASVDVIHVWNHVPIIDPMGFAMVGYTDEEEAAAHKLLTETVRKVDADRGDVRINEIVTQGSPSQALLSAAKGAELVVVGRRGRGGFLGLLLGSVATQVVNHCPCPVVVVNAP